MRKADVEFHLDDRHNYVPAVNVRVYSDISSVKLPLEQGRYKNEGEEEWHDIKSDERFTMDWINERFGDDLPEWVWKAAIRDGWEQLESIAQELWGKNVKVWSVGRSGGWAVVDGLSDFNSWDAIELNKWATFSMSGKAIAKDIPRVMIELIYMNIFEPEMETE